MKKTDDNVWPRFVISTQNSLIAKGSLGLLISPESLTFLQDGPETVFPVVNRATVCIYMCI